MNTEHRKHSELFTLTRGSEGGPKVLKTNQQHQDTMCSSSVTFPKIPSTFSSWGRAACPATEVGLHETFFHEEEEGRFFCLVCEAGAVVILKETSGEKYVKVFWYVWCAINLCRPYQYDCVA